MPAIIIIIIILLLLPRAHAQGVKQSVCMSIVVVVVVVFVGTKIARSRVLGICARCKHHQSVDIGEKLVYMRFELLKRLTSAINRAFSVRHVCGLSTTPTPLDCADATAHAQAQCWKGSSSYKTAKSIAILRYRARGVYMCSTEF